MFIYEMDQLKRFQMVAILNSQLSNLCAQTVHQVKPMIGLIENINVGNMKVELMFYNKQVNNFKMATASTLTQVFFLFPQSLFLTICWGKLNITFNFVK